MINFFSENSFELSNESLYQNWLTQIISSENKKEGELNYIFCDDEYLLEINVKYLNHDDYTDIISFENSVGNILHGDIFISIERVQENAQKLNIEFDEELLRVMAHGLLHFCGYKDKTDNEAALMRRKEDEKMKMFHVEQ
jgi:rRNA maturation RNase YbeY